MDNQHKKISGYRDLSASEIALMNQIKQKGQELLFLQDELCDLLSTEKAAKKAQAIKSLEGAEFSGKPYTEETGNTDECLEYRRFVQAEPMRWAAIGKTDIETGIMALVRAVAQPSG